MPVPGEAIYQYQLGLPSGSLSWLHATAGLDVAEVSRKHANQIFRDQFSPQNLLKQFLRGAPEVLEALAKAPNRLSV